MFRTPRGHLVSAGSSHPDVFCEKGVLRTLAKFTKSCNFIKKQTPAQVFSSGFCEITKNTFFSGTALALKYAKFSEKLMFLTL